VTDLTARLCGFHGRSVGSSTHRERRPALSARLSVLGTSPPSLRRLETLEAILVRMRAEGDPELQGLILDLEERIRLTVRELAELDAAETER
jgi:hypothetical protein